MGGWGAIGLGLAAALVLLLATSLAGQMPLLTTYRRPRRSPFQAAADKAKRELQDRIQDRAPGAKVSDLGCIGDLGPESLGVWVKTRTDAERDGLLADATLKQTLDQALSQAGYPEAAIPHVELTIQSQETVDRDYEGNWFYAMR
jgi:hypothetical protein